MPGLNSRNHPASLGRRAPSQISVCLTGAGRGLVDSLEWSSRQTSVPEWLLGLGDGTVIDPFRPVPLCTNVARLLAIAARVDGHIHLKHAPRPI